MQGDCGDRFDTRRLRLAWLSLLWLCTLSPLAIARDLSKDLVKAVKTGELLKVVSLLNEGADPNTRGEATEFETGRPVILLTSELGIVKALLGKGVDVNVQTSCIAPSAHWVQQHAKGSRTGCEDGVTALYLAVGRRNTELVNVLLEGGADPTIKTSSGDDALLHAKRTAFPPAVLAIIKSQARDTPLILAVQLGETSEVRSLLQEKIDVNAKDKQGLPALMFASALRGGGGLVQLLLAAGADANSRTPAGRNTQLDRVVGGTVFSLAPGGTTPLMLAASNADINAVSALVQHGADISAVDEDGNTACQSLPRPPDPTGDQAPQRTSLSTTLTVIGSSSAAPRISPGALAAVRALVCK